jgi:hypothetical protein
LCSLPLLLHFRSAPPSILTLLPLSNAAAGALARPFGHEVSRPATKCPQLITLKSTNFHERGGMVELPCGPLESYTLCSALRSSASASAMEPLHMPASKSGWLKVSSCPVHRPRATEGLTGSWMPAVCSTKVPPRIASLRMIFLPHTLLWGSGHQRCDIDANKHYKG